MWVKPSKAGVTKGQFAVRRGGRWAEVVEKLPRMVKNVCTWGDPPPHPHPKQSTKPQKEEKVQAGFDSLDRVEFTQKDTEAEFILIHSGWHIWVTGAFLCSLCVYPDSALIHFHQLLRKFAVSVCRKDDPNSNSKEKLKSFCFPKSCWCSGRYCLHKYHS